MVSWALSILSKLVSGVADLLALAPLSAGGIIVLGGAAILLLVQHYSHRQKFTDRLEALGNMKHKASHLLRDKYFDLVRLRKTSGLTLEVLSGELESVGKEFVTFVAELLTTLSGHQVNVCIKAIDNPRQPYPTTAEDWKRVQVYTLCRSAKSKPRPKNMPRFVAVSDNTDFLLIMRDEGDSFAVPDLRKYDKGLKKMGNKVGYLNSTPNWADFYITTIVAPIRIEAAHLGIKEARYDLLGFLCADSLSPSAFPERGISHYAQLMLSFGDDLYQYFSQVTEAGEEIKSKTMMVPEA